MNRIPFLSESLANFALSTTFEAIPEKVRTWVRLLVLDAVGNAFASTSHDFAHRALAGLQGMDTGDFGVIGMPARLTLRDAVLMNGILVHGLDFDDTYLPGAAHLTASVVVIGATLQKNLPYRVPQDFTAIAQVAWSPMVLVVNRSLPLNSVQELISLAKAKPDALNYASIGTGSLASLSAAMFKGAASVRLTEVGYQGKAPALTALLSGETQLMFSVLGAALPHIRAGRMKALAMASASRSTLLPELPTVAESGLPGFDSMCWHGIFGPRGLSPPLVETLNKAIVAVLEKTETRTQFATLGFETAPTTSTQFDSYLHSEMAKWRRAILVANLAAGE